MHHPREGLWMVKDEKCRNLLYLKWAVNEKSSKIIFGIFHCMSNVMHKRFSFSFIYWNIPEVFYNDFYIVKLDFVLTYSKLRCYYG